MYRTIGRWNKKSVPRIRVLYRFRTSNILLFFFLLFRHRRKTSSYFKVNISVINLGNGSPFSWFVSEDTVRFNRLGYPKNFMTCILNLLVLSSNIHLHSNEGTVSFHFIKMTLSTLTFLTCRPTSRDPE